MSGNINGADSSHASLARAPGYAGASTLFRCRILPPVWYFQSIDVYFYEQIFFGEFDFVDGRPAKQPRSGTPANSIKCYANSAGLAPIFYCSYLPTILVISDSAVARASSTGFFPARTEFR